MNTNPAWQRLRQAIGLPQMAGYFDNAYAQFQLPEEKTPLLDRAFIREHRENHFRFSPELTQALFEAEDVILQDPELYEAARFLNWAIFRHKKAYEDPYVNDFYPERMGDRKGLFPMVVLCANAPHAFREMQRRGLDVRDVAGNFASLSGFADGYYRATGHYGLGGCGWNVICVSEYLNTVGTLRFAPAVLGDNYTVYQHQETGEYKCMAGAGIPCLNEGVLAPSREKADFVTASALDGDLLTAHEVAFTGRVAREPIPLNLKEWRRVLGEGDEVLEYHIPTSPNYKPELVFQSFHKAVAYFTEHFPELNLKGFWCYSWLYCPEMEELFDNPDVGILKVHRLVRKVPVEGGPDCFHPFVFDVPFETPLDQLPARTSLHRGIIQARRAGRPLGPGGVMMPLSEMEKMEERIHG